MSRRVYEVIATSEESFVEPITFDEASSRKTKLQEDIETVMLELGDKTQRDTLGTEWNQWHTNKVRVLHAKQRELRRVKAWISTKKGGTKPSEWALLARAYRLIDGLPDKTDEAEHLLDDIEYVLPGSYLQEPAARAG